MKLFKDSELKKELDIKKAIPLGIVDVGEVEAFEFWIVNDSPHEVINLKYELKNIDRETKEVTEVTSEESRVIEAPEKLLPYASDILIIEYAPSIDFELGLQVMLQMKGKSLRD